VGRLFKVHGSTVGNETIAHGDRLSVFGIRAFRVVGVGFMLLAFPASTNYTADGGVGIGEAIVEDVLEIYYVRSHD
jgi:hypothetical protein